MHMRHCMYLLQLIHIPKQDDLTSDRYKEASGLKDMMKVFNFMGSMTTVQFEIDDIVRSGFVRDFIIAENQLGLY